MPSKDNKCYLSIGKIASKLNLPVHTIRFWSDNFKNIIDYKVGTGGRRYYSDEHLSEFQKIKELVYEKNINLAGIKNMVKYKTIKEKNYFLNDNEKYTKVINECLTLIQEIRSLNNI